MRTLIVVLAIQSVATSYADTPELTGQVVVKPAPRPPSLALPQGRLGLALTLEVEMSANKIGEPLTIAPDITYGATDALSLSVVHSKFATTGFRAVAGGGVCVGDDSACPHVYNNAGVEALYALRNGPLSIAAIGGVHAINFDAGYYHAKVGTRVRYVAGRAGILASPSVLIAMTKRTDVMGTSRNKDLYYVPVLATYKLIPAFTVGLGSGVKGSLNDVGGTWEIPFGAVATYAIDRRITIGASFVFGKLIGGANDPPDPAPPATGIDYRGTQLWVVLTP